MKSLVGEQKLKCNENGATAILTMCRGEHVNQSYPLWSHWPYRHRLPANVDVYFACGTATHRLLNAYRCRQREVKKKAANVSACFFSPFLRFPRFLRLSRMDDLFALLFAHMPIASLSCGCVVGCVAHIIHICTLRNAKISTCKLFVFFSFEKLTHPMRSDLVFSVVRKYIGPSFHCALQAFYALRHPSSDRSEPIHNGTNQLKLIRDQIRN